MRCLPASHRSSGRPRLRLLALGATCLLAGLSPREAKAESPLSFIPEDAAVVLRLKSARATLKTVLPWFPEKLRDDAKEAILRPWRALGKDFLASEESWAVLLPGPPGNAHSVYIVRTSAAADVLELHPPLGFAKVAEWYIFADSNVTATRLKECRAGKIKSLASAMRRPSQEIFDNGSVASLFVNGEEMRAQFRKDLGDLKSSISTTLVDMFTSLMGAGIAVVGVPAKRTSDAKLLVAAEVLSHAAAHLIDDTDTLAAELSVDKDGIELHVLMAVAPNSPTDGFLARHPPSEMKPLAHLPSPAMGYFGVAGDLPELTRWLAQFNLSSLLRPAAVRGAIDRKLQSLPLTKVDGYFGSLDFGEAIAGPMVSTQVIESRPSQPAREFQSRLVDLTSEIEEPTKKPPANRGRFQPRAETLAGHSVDLATWATPDRSELGNNDLGRGVLKIIYGAAPLQETRVASLSDLVLICDACGRRAMLGLLRNFETGEGAAHLRGWQNARARLNDRANLILMLDLTRWEFVWLNCVNLLPALGDPAEAKAATEKWEANSLKFIRAGGSTYCGLSVAFERHGVRCKVHVPREQVSGVFGLFQLTTDAFEAQINRPARDAHRPELPPEQ